MLINNKKIMGAITALFLVFSGCGSGEGSSSSVETTSLSGLAQKGAFYKDSNVTLCKLDGEMKCITDKILRTKVKDDKGSYRFEELPWSGLSRLTVSGYYFDEVTGQKSLSSATITAIVNIKSNTKQKSNINVLTDISAKRMKDLVKSGVRLDDALDEAKNDVKNLFNIKSDDFTSLDLEDFSQGLSNAIVQDKNINLYVNVAFLAI